jgi:hypothetical protein
VRSVGQFQQGLTGVSVSARISRQTGDQVPLAALG